MDFQAEFLIEASELLEKLEHLSLKFKKQGVEPALFDEIFSSGSYP